MEGGNVDEPQTDMSGVGIISLAPRSMGLAVNHFPFLGNIAQLARIARFALRRAGHELGDNRRRCVGKFHLANRTRRWTAILGTTRKWRLSLCARVDGSPGWR